MQNKACATDQNILVREPGEARCVTYIYLLLSGLGPTLVSIAPFLAIQQCVYDVLKNIVVNGFVVTPNVSTFLICGAFAGTLAQTVSTFRLKLLIQLILTQNIRYVEPFFQILLPYLEFRQQI